MRLPLFCVVVMTFGALLASGGVGRQHHQGNFKHVRPQKRAQTEIADTTQYNHDRPHSSIGNKTPIEFMKAISTTCPPMA